MQPDIKLVSLYVNFNLIGWQEEELQEKRAEFERKKAEIDKSMRNLENQVGGVMDM